MEIGLARLIGAGVGLILSVIYTALFAGALYTLNRRKKSSNISIVIPIVLIVMFILNCSQLALQATDIYNAFIRFRDIPGGPSAYFLDYGSNILPARDAIFWVMSVIADSLVCWRLYVIWLKNKYIIIVPVLLLTTGFMCGVTMIIYTVQRTVEDSTRLVPIVDRWWMITVAFIIAVNVITPGLIIGRLWYIARSLGVIGSRSSRPYKQIASALIESGALYTLACAGWLVIFTSGSLPALFMSACILPTIVAIVPTLIILRLNTFGPDPSSIPHQLSGGDLPLSAWAGAGPAPITVTHQYHSDQDPSLASSPRTGGRPRLPRSFVGSDDDRSVELKDVRPDDIPDQRPPTTIRFPPGLQRSPEANEHVVASDLQLSR